jgi:dTDP-4-amino-4,6-dideoxygalactose transaminase
VNCSREASTVPFVDLEAQYRLLARTIQETTRRILRGGEYILGTEVGLFEQEFSAYCGARYGIGVDSGTSALELALRAFNIGHGDEVVVPANTFIATALAVTATGATPVLVDVDPHTYNLDADLLPGALTTRTKAIIPVHLYGQPADMDPILTVADRRGLIVIEDSCQAHGAKYKGRRVGSLGHAAAFSFYPTKNLGAYGDGGMIVTDDAGVAEAAQMLRNYGQREKYQHLVKGFNHRLDTLQAALLRLKLQHLDAWNELRRSHARFYHRLLGGSDVIPPFEADYAESVWHLYVIRAPQRDALRCHLAAQNIGTGIHYPTPIHLQPAYRELGYGPGDFPITELQAAESLSLPMYPELPREAIRHVAGTLRNLVGPTAPNRRISVRRGVAPLRPFTSPSPATHSSGGCDDASG